MTYFLYVILNDSEESHRKSMATYIFSLGWWDISLALNMTYFLYVILNEVKNPTEKVGSIYFITLLVGYFACAQYDGTTFCRDLYLR